MRLICVDVLKTKVSVRTGADECILVNIAYRLNRAKYEAFGRFRAHETNTMIAEVHKYIRKKGNADPSDVLLD